MLKVKKGLISKVLGAALIGVMIFSGKAYAAEEEKNINLDCVKGFSYFFTGDFTCHSMHTEGKIAVGGTLTSAGNLSICTNDPVKEPTLVIGKKININNLQDKYGYCAVEKGCTIESKNKIEIQSYMNSTESKDEKYKNPVEEDVFDFDKVGETLKQYSNELANLESNEKKEIKDGRMLLKSDRTKGTAIFSITADEINEVGQQIDIDVDTNVTVLINVAGKNVTIPNSGEINSLKTYKMNVFGKEASDYYGNILWNFNEAEQINLGLSYKGTILAPNADIKITSTGNMEGQLIAKSFEQAKEIEYSSYESHINLFKGNIQEKLKKPEIPSTKLEPSIITIIKEYTEKKVNSENKSEAEKIEPKKEEPEVESKTEIKKKESKEETNEVSKTNMETQTPSKQKNPDKGQYIPKEEPENPTVVPTVEHKEVTNTSKGTPDPKPTTTVDSGDNMLSMILTMAAMIGSAIIIFKSRRCKKNVGIN